MILVWGVREDPPILAVLAALERRKATAFFLDQNGGPATWFEPAPGDVLRGRLHSAGGSLELERITAAYLRPVATDHRLADRGTGEAERWRAMSSEEALFCWADTTPARVVNRPEAMASNTSKPYQTALIHRAGFIVPETLVTTDVTALADFHAHHGTLIYKSVSGVRSIVARYDPADASRAGTLVTCPTQFQRWISGTDVRVHVIGDAVFACEVVSSAFDYRYPTCEAEQPRIIACTLPEAIAERCRRLAAAVGLAFAGIDLRRTAEGDWVCFEVNPSPGFTYYEAVTGDPISDALAALLAKTC